MKEIKELSIDFASTAFLSDPYRYLSIIAETTPVVYDAYLNRWWLLDHKNAEGLLKDATNLCHDLSKADSNTASYRFISILGDERFAPLFQDPPFHTKLRSAVSRFFTLSAAQNLRPLIQNHADGLIEKLLQIEDVDLVRDYISPFTIGIITKVLGLDILDPIRYSELVSLNNLTFSVTLTATQRATVKDAQRELASIIKYTCMQRNRLPRDDVITMLVQGDFNEQQVLAMCQFLIRAGNLTSTDLISNTIYALLQNPLEKMKLRDNPLLIPDVIEESLRYDTPALEAGRITVNRLTVCGVTIPARQTLMISLGYANRDNKYFDNPDRFDITRLNKRHLAFGGGRHICLGAPLARVEAQIAVDTLIRRFPNLHQHPNKLAERHLLPSFHGFKTLPVSLDL